MAHRLNLHDSNVFKVTLPSQCKENFLFCLSLPHLLLSPFFNVTSTKWSGSRDPASRQSQITEFGFFKAWNMQLISHVCSNHRSYRAVCEPSVDLSFYASDPAFFRDVQYRSAETLYCCWAKLEEMWIFFENLLTFWINWDVSKKQRIFSFLKPEICFRNGLFLFYQTSRGRENIRIQLHYIKNHHQHKHPLRLQRAS